MNYDRRRRRVVKRLAPNEPTVRANARPGMGKVEKSKRPKVQSPRAGVQELRVQGFEEMRNADLGLRIGEQEKEAGFDRLTAGETTHWPIRSSSPQLIACSGSRLGGQGRVLRACPPKARRRRMEAAGIEPASRDMSGRVSTCVVRCLISKPPAPTNRLRQFPAQLTPRNVPPSDTRCQPAGCRPGPDSRRLRSDGLPYLGSHSQWVIGI